jgi:hypothetical protein
MADHAIETNHGGLSPFVGVTSMPYQMKPLSCDPAKIAGMSERLIFSHYENNYGGAVKRLNMDFGAKAGNYVETFMGTVRWGNADQLFNETIGNAGRV